MKAADARTMTIDQLDDEVLKLKKEQFNLRFQRATGQLENTARVRQVRRTIALLKTLASQKRTGTEPKAAAASAAAAKAAPEGPSRRGLKRSPEARAKAKAKANTKPKSEARTGKRAKAKAQAKTK